MQEETGNGEGLGIFRKMCVGGFMNQDVGETQIARKLVNQYPELSDRISFRGLQKLARRALLRGYSEKMVMFGLDTVIKKTISETNITEMMRLMRNASYWMPSFEPL